MHDDAAQAAQAAQEAHEAGIQRHVDARCLGHQLTWMRRSAVALPIDLLWAALAHVSQVPAWAWVPWLVLRVGLHGAILVQAGRWAPLIEQDPRRGLRLAGRVMTLYGVMHATLMPFFYFGTDDSTKLLAMALSASYFGGAVVSASGQQGSFWRMVLPGYAVYVAGWLQRGGPLGWAMVGLLLHSVPLIVLSIRQQRQSWQALVRLADDRERLAGALAIERDRAQAAADARSRFFAAASHDLRQPLHALSINATTLMLLARQADDPRLRELSQGITRALMQSQGLLDALLDISRLDAGAVPLQPADVDLAALLRQLHAEFAGQAAEQGLGFALALPDAPAWARTDVDLLQRVLRNLLDNAFKFTSDGQVGLALQRLPAGAGPAEWQVDVTDTGCGIAEADRERVFEEFFQVGNPARDRSRGLGLGLAIVQRSARLLGLAVSLQAGPGGRGTLFSLRLPALDDPTPGAPDRPAQQADLPWPAQSVLLVDDEADILHALSGLLQALGWHTHSAGDADAALALAADPSLPLSVAVVDQRLPQGDGISLVGRLRALRPGLPALIVTGDVALQWQVRRHGLRVLHKPLDGAALAAAIQGEVAAATRWQQRLDNFPTPEGAPPMNLIDALHGRRSIRHYLPTALPHAQVEDLLWHAVQVPRPPICTDDAWAFVVIAGVQRLTALGARAKAYAAQHQARLQSPQHPWAWPSRDDFEVFWGAPVLVLMCARQHHPEAPFDCCRAGQNLALAAHAAGLGSCWVGSPLPWLASDEGRQAAGLPAGYDVAVAMVLGQPAEPVPGQSAPRPTIHWHDDEAAA